ncbi:glycoside hydrolase family 3 N-terminal domain-containing protein [Agilicoccus flavus]|uniref:glycoside hydrolase family 3 N-terminal domain-containing protein n=1 Tax=Agilicoccus flavus TaxID=2775968 RepID=UPI001CF648B1|nr:glycoside hydrolase family 3 N-terminal domain-containing protein [Agilicoccus flavus]
MASWNDPGRSVDDRADALLRELSPQEKAAQLGSFWPAPRAAATVTGDVAPMEGALASGLSWDETIAHGLGHLTRNYGTEPVEVEAGLAALREYQRQVVAANRHGIPAIVHEECLTGFTAYGATVYPAALAWGATFDPDLVEEMAAAIGADLAAVRVHQGLSPLLDVVRDYRWGRCEETCGEDPYVVGVLGSAYVRGLQSAGVVATPKHFVGYSASKAGRNHAPVAVGRRELEDVLLPPFEMAIREGGARSIMNSYSDVDGVAAGASVDLLTGVLRDRWGFTGTVVSDYWSVIFLRLMHRIAADDEAAGILALTAGIDVELPNTGGYGHLAEAVEAGRLAPELLDRAARRVLRQKIELGLLDEGWDAGAQGEERDLDSPGNRDIARRLAERSVVLCANDGVLPLPPGRRLALVGPCADEVRTFMGCYAFPNHVMVKYPEMDLGLRIDSLADALAQEFDGEVVVEPGVPILEPDDARLAAAVAAAAAADVAVVAVGDLAGLFGLGTSGEGCDSVDLSLPGLQGRLVEEVLATGTPVVLVVVSGRPYSLGAYAPRCAAVVQAFMPGVEGGAAIAGVLSGRVEPTGKLPVGIPDHPGGQPGTYLAPPLGWYSEGVSNLDPRPLYPFGHGLGYTGYGLSDLTVSATEVAPDGSVEVSATVKNVGDRDGAQVVQLYLTDVVASVVRPRLQLVGFARVPLRAGEARRVSFEVHTDRTSFTGVDLRRIVEPGEFVVRVGTSSEDLPLEGRFTVTGDVRIVPEGRVLTTPVTLTDA